MKTLLTIMAVLFCSCVFAQEIPTPDYTARPYLLKSNNTLESIERADANQDMKVKGMGYGGVNIYYTAFGPSSSTRFAKENLPKLIIKIEPNADPEEIISLTKGEVKKDRRRFLMRSQSMTGSVRNTSQVEVKLNFKKIREGVFQIILPENILPGEYAFMPMISMNVGSMSMGSNSIKISCFGIEASTNEPPEQAKEAPHPHDPLGEAIYKEIQKKKAKEAELNNANPRIETNTTEPVKNIPAVKEETKITPPKPVYQEPIKEEPKVVVPASIETTSQPPIRQVKVTYSRTEEIPAPKPAPVPVAPATKTVSDSGVEELIKWKKMLDAGVITQAEYEAKKKQVLGN